MFDDCDLDRSGGLDKEELRQCMQAHFGVKLDEDSTAYIFKVFDSNGSGELELHEFNGQAIAATIQQHMREKEAQTLWKQEQKASAEASSKETEASSKPVRTWENVLAEGNQDDTVLVRLACVLAYLLPLCDGILFGLPIVRMAPWQLLQLFMPFLAILKFVDDIPLGVLIWFFTMSQLSRNVRTPGLMRFNMRQAIRLDIRICLFRFLLDLAYPFFQSLLPLSEETINQGMIQEEPTLVATVLISLGRILATFAFMLLMAIISFGVACSITGDVPRGIPFISEKTASFLGVHCLSSNSDML